MEAGVALLVMAGAMVLVAQLGYWSVRHRARTAAQFLAAELAANVLEEASAMAWHNLTDDWAESHQISDEVARQLVAATMTVQVQQLEAQPLVKRVTVEIQWTLVDDADSHTVRLTGFFSPRQAPLPEAKR